MVPRNNRAIVKSQKVIFVQNDEHKLLQLQLQTVQSFILCSPHSHNSSAPSFQTFAYCSPSLKVHTLSLWAVIRGSHSDLAIPPLSSPCIKAFCLQLCENQTNPDGRKHALTTCRCYTDWLKSTICIEMYLSSLITLYFSACYAFIVGLVSFLQTSPEVFILYFRVFQMAALIRLVMRSGD